jgi:hypothetical protein
VQVTNHSSVLTILREEITRHEQDIEALARLQNSIKEYMETLVRGNTDNGHLVASGIQLETIQTDWEIEEKAIITEFQVPVFAPLLNDASLLSFRYRYLSHCA